MERTLSRKYSEQLIKITIKGVDGWAWERTLLLEFLNDIEECRNYVIFGGDVLRVFKGEMEYTYDSWSITKREYLESFDDYSLRSIKKSMDYVSLYPDLPNILFVLVMTSEVTAGL